MDAPTHPVAPPLILAEDRFARFEVIEWWDQSALRNAKILVIGAGALGNEVLKNLALLGAGHIAVVDMDRVERSNLSRSVLFRDKDANSSKAICAAAAVHDICDVVNAIPIVGTVQGDVGLGWFRWADIVVGAVDNREARVFINSACAQAGRPWIDGGIEVFQGIVRGFRAPDTACYECTMSSVDWELINQRRSCSLLSRRAVAAGGTPTTPTTASIIGAIQAQEVVKFIHGIEALMGRGFVYEGKRHESYAIAYSKDPSCGWHGGPANVEEVREFNSNTPLPVIWNWAEDRIGELDAIDLSREIVSSLECTRCEMNGPVYACLEKLSGERVPCAQCGTERIPHYLHSIARDSDARRMCPSELGIPSWDILWARNSETILGIELAGDKAALLGRPMHGAKL